jgi:cephalosporin hydroxylase
VALVEETNARHVIELGTRSGVSTVAWLHGLASTGGRLTSVDIDARPDIGVYAHWKFIQGNDLDPDVLVRLDPADIVFIDTSHLYEHTLAELNVYRWLARRYIVCHDTELAQPEGAPAHPRYPVRTAVEEFCAAEGLSWTNHPHCWGLGIIEVGR